MKNLFILFALFMGFMVKAQDGYDLSDEAYIKISKTVKGLDSLEARKFADRIAETAKADFVYLETKKFQNWIKHRYIAKKLMPLPENWSRSDCERCLIVVFEVYHKGANRDLEIEGERQLKFSYASGKYLDLFPFWKEKFLPSATPEKSLENFRYREVKSRKFDVDVRLQNIRGWRINNRSF